MVIHIIAELTGVDPAKISRVEDVKKVLDTAISKGKLNVVSSSFHQFEPYGVSGVYLLKESHLSIHTWPENGLVSLDIFTCNKDDRGALITFESIVEQFKPKHVEKKIIRRKIYEETQIQHRL
jgi:S-adenosylmethionine decarboxylase